jgi:hypothetical protein
MAKTFDDLRDARLSHEERLTRLDTLANFMDAAIVVPGTNIRFGADALIGLVPGIGDLATAAISCVIVLEARRMGAPRHVIARMIGNVAIDALAGSVPILGDLVDVAFRANLRNMRLLRRHFEQARRS